MFTKILLAFLIPLCMGLLADHDLPDKVSLEAMAKQIVALGSLVQTLSTQVQTLTSKLDVVIRKQGAVVSFKAYLSTNTAFAMGTTILFDTVESNVGGGYNTSSGVFHVPTTGIYIFTVQIDTKEEGQSDFELYNDGKGESLMTVMGKYDSTTTTVTIHANKGNDIYVKKVYDYKNALLRGGYWTQFSGHLLRAD